MTKATHTPGPWHRNIRANGKYPVIFVGRNQHVAVATGHETISPDEIEANIDLIAAAPELLAALEALHSCHRGFSNSPDWTALDDDAREIAETAIAKARGETR